MENLLIVVNKKDQVLGYKPKAVCHQEMGILHRAFSVFIFNRKGELLLQRRSSQKPLWPLYWSNTCCSHPGKDELIKAAAEKRLKAEMGFSCSLKFVSKLQYQAAYESAGAENEITYIFRGEFDGKVKPDKNEVAAVKWLGLEKLKQELKNNSSQYSPWLKKIIKKFSIFNEFSMTQFSKKMTFSAPGKIILSGEHAVVYGYPCLVAAIDRRVYLSFHTHGRRCQMIESFGFEIKNTLPGSGLGSSGALAVVEAAALSYIIKQKLDKEKISAIAHSIENLAHGTSSGVDTTVACFGGVMLYQNKKFKSLPAGRQALKFKKMPEFLLIDTGRPVETTGEMVKNLKFKMQNSKLQLKIKKLFKMIGQLPNQFVKALEVGNLSNLGYLIKRNERLLEELGVVGERAKKIIRAIEKLAGAAKICGAGGIRQGSGMALVYHPHLGLIKKFCQESKVEFYQVKLGEEGLRREK